MSDRATLKTFFETGDFPTAAQFADLIDQVVNIIDDEAEQLIITPVSNLEALNWNTTSVPIVPAQGALTVVKVTSIIARIIFATTAYTPAPGSRLEYHESALSGAIVASQQASFITQVVSTIEQASFDPFYQVMLPNLPIVSAMTVADPTLGDSTFSIHTTFKAVKF